MEINLLEKEECKFVINYTASVLEVLDKKAEVLDIFKKAPVKGYRQNKVPLDVIKIKYKDQINDALKKALAEEAYHKTVSDKKLKPYGAPKFNSLSLEGDKFVCEFEMLTKPEFTLNQEDYTNLEIPKPHLEKSETVLVEEMLQDLRVRLGEVSQFTEDDRVEVNDNIILNYVGSVNGEKVDSLCVEGELLTVGKSEIPRLNEVLIGMKVGDKREFTFSMSENILPSLKDKEILLQVELVTGSKTVPCPLDDTLAEKMQKQSLDEVRELIRGVASAKVQEAQKNAFVNSLMSRLFEKVSITVPNWMKLSEAQYLAQNSKLNWLNLSDEDKEKFLEVADKNVKMSLILDKVREQEPDAQLTDHETFELVKNNLKKTKQDVNLDDVIKQMQSTGYLQILFSRIKDEFTIDFLVKSNKTVE